MTTENTVLWNSFGHELRKLAFPQQMLQAAENMLAGAGRAAGAGAHAAGRAGSELLGGIPSRMNRLGANRARQALLEQLAHLEELSMKAKAPSKGMFQGRAAHQAALDTWARAQETMGARRQMLQQQLPMFDDEIQRLSQHIQALKQQPWTTPLRPQSRQPLYGQ